MRLISRPPTDRSPNNIFIERLISSLRAFRSFHPIAARTFGHYQSALVVTRVPVVMSARHRSLVVDIREIRLLLPFVTTICLVNLKQGLDHWAAVRPRPNNLLLCGAGGDGSATGKHKDSPDHGRNFCAKKVKIRCRLAAASRRPGRSPSALRAAFDIGYFPPNAPPDD
jgi:hypothetical protein